MTRLELAPDATGKRRRKNFTSATQQGAIDKKQAYQTNVSRNISPEGLKVKFRDYSTWWLKNVAPHTCNPNTINNYETTLRLHITPILGNMQLQDIRGRHVDELVYSIQGKGLSLSARKAARRVISTIFSDARRRDLVDDNPVTRSLPPRTAPGEFPKRKATLTQTKQHTFCNTSKGISTACYSRHTSIQGCDAVKWPASPGVTSRITLASHL